MFIHVKKSGKSSQNWGRRKDYLHNRRKQLSETMKDGIMPVDQMKKGTDGFMSHDQQVEKYGKWQEGNKENMKEWHELNRIFKKQGEEGKVMSLDSIRESKTSGKDIKYE